ncbi:MAG: hypothetical protein KC684_07435, partial [Candidatus Omnitrophica bacterium]|nr:hypothetical protein [Candidatus Omnitrophota bacterium]
MKRIVMFSILMLLSVDGLAKTQHPDNVNLFRHAIRDENRPLIREVVQKIAEGDEEAVAYMKENLPKDFVIYKLWETAIEIREIGG